MKLRILSATLVALFAAAGVHAAPLSDLLQGGTITAGDKLFDNWTLVNYAASDPNRAFNAANIDVQPLNDGGLNPGPGLAFSVSSGELDVTGDGIFAFVDLMFSFRASVLAPGLAIKDNSLQLTAGLVTNSGDNGFYVHEDVGTTPGGNDLGTKQVEFSFLAPNLISNLSDSATFTPQTDLWVTKNILVWATDPAETASLQGFQQRFSQAPIPEPATLALAAMGLAGLIGVRRRWV